MGPANGIIGQDNPVELPQTQVPEQDLSREKQMAAFFNGQEFQIFKSVMEQRIDTYKAYLPGADGDVVHMDKLSNEERGWRWLAADTIIREFQSVLDAYQNAQEAVKTSHEATK
jgi:hypothetical protein